MTQRVRQPFLQRQQRLDPTVRGIEQTFDIALTHADVQLLEFEDTHPRHTGLKVDAIRMRLGMTSARYYQRLHWLTRQQEVVAQWPQTASRVQRRVSRRIEGREQLRQWLS